MENKNIIFIKKANTIHGVKYNYSKIIYSNNKNKITIICPEHGDFNQTPNSHLSGVGCPKCGLIKKANSKRKKLDVFILNANKKHNHRYDYSILQYKHTHSKVRIICSKHGEFEQTPNNHLKGHGCPICSYIERSEDKKSNTIEFINKSLLIHGDKYDYSLVEYIGALIKVIITCEKHGMFLQTPNNHLNGQGCPICKESKGENKIRDYLNKNNINFIPQHRFPDCRKIRPLPFDFYLPEHNTCIEYQGEQHYKPIEWFGGEQVFNDILNRDEIKKKYCKQKNIKLIIINQTDLLKNKLNLF
jgi:hypothetical protein